jgi:phytoene dehydrogenase-like protein
MSKSIIVIGAGIAGLSAGCYAQMNGYQTHIFELHDKPGGVCTSWKRKDYTVDGCIHWLIGSAKDSSFYHIWEELGAVQGRQFINFYEFSRVEDEHGKAFSVYANLDALEKHMVELAPEDKTTIEKFIGGARRLTRYVWEVDKAPELYNPIDSLKMMFSMLPFMGTLMKWRNVSTASYAQRFRNPFLRQAFHAAFNGDIQDFSTFFVQINLAWQHIKQAGYPIGGSLAFSRSIEKRYLTLGGKIDYRSPVAKILVENDRAVGVRLADGTEHRSDIVISAADGHTTIFNMLDAKYIDDRIRGYYEKWPLYSPLIYVALGVSRSFAGLPHQITYLLDKPINIDNKEQKNIYVNIYSYDPTLAPAGKTLIIAILTAQYDYWKKLREGNLVKYKEAKEKIADQVIDFLESRFPGLRAQVEMRDVATPVTWERYTTNWRGSYEGWLSTTKNFMKSISKELPGLKNFYMAGQWVEPGGGVPPAALSGRNVIQIICKRDKKQFVTTLP